MSYLIDTQTAINLVHTIRKQNEKVIFTHGTFDLFHRGHNYFLSESKKQGDILIVGVEPDFNVRQYKRFFRPIINEQDRSHIVASLKHVDFVFLIEEVERLKSDYYLKLYKEMEPNSVTYGRNFKYEKQYNTHIERTKYIKIEDELDKKHSTTKIINKILQGK